MSYIKTNWVDKTPTNSGTPVNADNLNKIEQGIENATLHAEQNEASIKDLRQNTANAIIGTASGETVALTDVQEGTSARSLKILGETTETGEGEKSPTNPYTLEGVEGIANISVSDGTNTDDYPITLPQPLYSLPDGTRDYIEVNHKDKTATLKQNVGVVELDGTENWIGPVDYDTHWEVRLVPTPTKISMGTYNSTHFVASSPTIPTSYIRIGGGNNTITMRLLKTDFPNKESWLSWLSTQHSNGTPVKILYKINETESNLPYFDIPLYSPTSTISTDQGGLEVEYNRDINTALSEGGLDPADFVPRVNQANRVYITNATAQQDTKPISEFAMKVDLGDKLDKTNVANRVYGTNATGNQIYYPTGLFASGATIKVAASNASDKSKASADYVCSGVGDQDTLSQAVDALPTYGGSIELSEGSFNFNADFEFYKYNVTIKGQGHSTNIINNINNLLSVYADNFCIKECQVGVLDIAGSQAVIENCHADEVYVLGDTTMTNCYVSDTLEVIDDSLILIGNRINTLLVAGGTVLPSTAAEIRKLNVVDTITGL
jgi:hypothetical protein